MLHPLHALLTGMLVFGFASSASPAAPAPDGLRDRLVEDLLADVTPQGRDALPAGGRELFLAVLGSEAFEHAAVGPFDIYAYVADGLGKRRKARKLVRKAAQGLEPLLPVMQQHYQQDQGVVSGHRFPLVLTRSRVEQGEQGFDRVLALLDRCEDDGYSGFKPHLQVWTPSNRRKNTVFTWEVQVFNLAHEWVRRQDDLWLRRGLGYSTINLLVNRMFALGAYGPPPPWLLNGLVDELDIEAYGDAWVAAAEKTTVNTYTEGWRRQGWSGFLPQGASPPPPVTGPPPNLTKTVVRITESDQWLSRSRSPMRHWNALVKDLRSPVPASLRSMAAGQRFSNRDRAYSRLVLHLALQLMPEQGLGLMEALDVPSRRSASGMPDGDPLPVVFARALGGEADVERLEQMTLGEFIESIGKPELTQQIRKLGGEGMLSIADHRQQARWLQRRRRMQQAVRQRLFEIVMEVEGYQQLQEWELLGRALDRAAGAVLAATPRFPKNERQRESVTETFWEALRG